MEIGDKYYRLSDNLAVEVVCRSMIRDSVSITFKDEFAIWWEATISYDLFLNDYKKVDEETTHIEFTDPGFIECGWGTPSPTISKFGPGKYEVELKAGDQVAPFQKPSNRFTAPVAGMYSVSVTGDSTVISLIDKDIQEEMDKISIPNTIQFAGDPIRPTDLNESYVREYFDIKPKKCECGAHACKSNFHSTWCCLYEEDK